MSTEQTLKEKGLFHKYDVTKRGTGESVTDCFVLRPDRDPVALELLRTYSKLTPDEDLADHLEEWIGEIEDAQRFKPQSCARCGGLADFAIEVTNDRGMEITTGTCGQHVADVMHGGETDDGPFMLATLRRLHTNV